jgi:hypothetical protein
MNSNYSKNTVELPADKDIKNIIEIPDYEVLVMACQPQIA